MPAVKNKISAIYIMFISLGSCPTDRILLIAVRVPASGLGNTVGNGMDGNLV